MALYLSLFFSPLTLTPLPPSPPSPPAPTIMAATLKASGFVRGHIHYLIFATKLSLNGLFCTMTFESYFYFFPFSIPFLCLQVCRPLSGITSFFSCVTKSNQSQPPLTTNVVFQSLPKELQHCKAITCSSFTKCFVTDKYLSSSFQVSISISLFPLLLHQCHIF